MKNNILAILAIILAITSCDVNGTRLKQSIKYVDGELSIDIKSSKEHHLTCMYFDDVFIDTLFKSSVNINLEDTLKNKFRWGWWKHKEAYSLITKGYVPIHVNIDNKVDTIFVRNVELAPDNNLYAIVKSGKICPIEKYYLSKKGQKILSEWLGDDNFVTAFELGKMMTRFHPNYYIAVNRDYTNNGENVPVLKNFVGQKYRIESNLKADKYYLYAPVNSSDLKDFIQDMIDNGFPSAAENLSSPLSCFREKGEGGRFVVFLIGINDNGSYSTIPIGIVAIDNVAPVVNHYSFGHIYNCNLDLYGVPWGLPNVQEEVTISNGQFRGNDALFEIEFDSGIESISIKREIHHDYMRYRYRPETKTIKLSDKESPYRFRYVLDLFIGDNYIPMTITDKFGNTTNYTHKITMREIKDND